MSLLQIHRNLHGPIQAVLNHPSHNLPVDIVGHCHDHQCPTNPSEDHHSALVQHFGSVNVTKLKPE